MVDCNHCINFAVNFKDVFLRIVTKGGFILPPSSPHFIVILRRDSFQSCYRRRADKNATFRAITTIRDWQYFVRFQTRIDNIKSSILILCQAARSASSNNLFDPRQ
jgi:hypothetical protein